MAKKKSPTQEPEVRAPKSRKANVIRREAKSAPATSAAPKPGAKSKPKAPPTHSSTPAAAKPAAKRDGSSRRATKPKHASAKTKPARRPAKQPAPPEPVAAPEPAPPPAKPRRTGPVSTADLLGPAASAPSRVFEVPEPALVEGRWRRSHAALLRLRDRVLDSMNTLAGSNLKRSHADERPSYGGMDEGDVGLESYDRDFALGLFSNGQDLLYEVEEALRRIVQGTYGDCESCGKPIPAVRIKAVPYARCCVGCQSQEERRQRTAAMVRRSAIAKERYSGQE